MVFNNNKITYGGYKGDEKLIKLLDPYIDCLDLVPIEELKTCPFCEGDAEIYIQELATSDPKRNMRYFVRCTKCNLQTRSVRIDDILNSGLRASTLTAIQSVVSLWNNRVEDDT